jgi:hypothetical protein
VTRPVFHKGNSLIKEKRTKKEKENRLWKMPQLWKSANQSVAFGGFFLMRIPTVAWKSLAKALGFSTFTTGPTTINRHGTNFHLKNYKGSLRRPNKCHATLKHGAAGEVRSLSQEGFDLPGRADLLR